MSALVKVRYEGDIAIIAFEDPKHRNCWTEQMIEESKKIFEEIRNRVTTKVVVFHGVGPYFGCGGNKEQLLAISQGKAMFNDSKIWRSLLDLELPTIAAMQGHALGGGLVLGLYADLIVMAEECFYSANFMHWGFTPGQGGTYIIPKKLGLVLGTEMVFTAKNYQGRELKERGVQPRIVKKDDVLSVALNLAKNLAEKPRLSLMLLKEHLANPIRKELDIAVKEELEMHKKCYVENEEVRQRIQKLFDEKSEYEK